MIDNYLPCIDDEDRLAFACSGNVGELWPSFLEKAYAKVRDGMVVIFCVPSRGLLSCSVPCGRYIVAGTLHPTAEAGSHLRACHPTTQMAMYGRLQSSSCSWDTTCDCCK